MAETNNDLVVPSDKVAESDPDPASVAPESPPTAESKTKNDNVPPADDKKEGNGETAAADTTGENSSKKKDSTAAKTDVAAPESSSDTKGSTDDAEATAEKDSSSKEKPKEAKPNDLSSGPVVSSSKKTRPPYKYDPEKVVLRFLFANRDGLTVTVECKPGDTVGEVKGQLLSVWPEDLPDCSGGDQLRLICMGKGMLMPDTRTLEDCQVPVFKTHPTPVNVAVRPKHSEVESTKTSKEKSGSGAGSTGNASGRTTEQSGQGCGCVIQ